MPRNNPDGNGRRVRGVCCCIMRALWLFALVALLAGCALPGLKPLRGGMAEAEVVQAWGPPTARYALPAGSRLEFALGPAGNQTWMVDLDPAGRAVAWRQVLSYENLQAVQGRLPGLTRDELRLQVGRPSETRPDRLGGEVWSWRHESPFCLWFQASIGTDGRVRDAAFAPDPACDFQDPR
jgi:hypothetical protein